MIGKSKNSPLVFLVVMSLSILTIVPASAELSVLSNSQMDKLTGVEGICYPEIQEACIPHTGKASDLDHLTMIEEIEDDTEELASENSTKRAAETAGKPPLPPQPETSPFPYDPETTQAAIDAVNRFLDLLQ